MSLKVLQVSQENTCGGVSLQTFRPATLLKRDSKKGVFSVKFTKFLKTPISKKICKRLLLSFSLPTILLCNNFIVSIVLTRFNSWLFSFFHYTISVNKLIFFKDNKIHSCDVITELGKTKLIFWSMGKTAKKSRVGRSAK